MTDKTEIKKSICFWCNQRCRLNVKIKDGHLVDVKEEEDPPEGVFSQFWMSPLRGCMKRANAKEIFYHPQRLKYPLKRAGDRGEGKWQTVSWSDAMGEIAEKLNSFREKYGAESVVTARGTLRTTDEYRSRFMNLFGSPNIIGHSAICYAPDALMLKAFIGGFPTRFLSPKAKCILIWGSQPSKSSWRMWRVIREHKAKGEIKFICVDPRGGDTPDIADIWLQPRPGTDCALALAMINVIIQENLYDKEFVANWCHGFEDLKKRAAEYTLEEVEKITWVPADKIIQAARMFAQNKPGGVATGQGLCELPNNIECFHAIFGMSAITGDIDIEGGLPLSGPHPSFICDREIDLEEALPQEQREKQIGADRFKLYSWRGTHLIQKEQKKFWGKSSSDWSVDSQAHTPTVYRAMISGEPYPVKALITLSCNPMIKSANTKLVYKALKSLDLHVVHDYFMTPTADIADYVLPGASWLERPYIFSGLNNFSLLYAGERALPTTVEGEYDRRTDFDFWRDLGVRLGQEEYWPWKTDEEAYDYRLAPLGFTFKEFMARGGIDATTFGFKKYETMGFGTPTGKIELSSMILEKLGYDPLPKYKEPPETPISNPDLAKEYPLIMISGGRTQPYYCSEHRQIDTFRRKWPDPQVQINPKTAMDLDIADGDWVWIETLRGRVRQKCKYFEGIDPRVIHAEYGWWYPEKPGEEPWLHGCWESNINVCTDDDPDHCSEMMGSWPLRNGLCKIYKCKEYK